jgi:hypothetical protein
MIESMSSSDKKVNCLSKFSTELSGLLTKNWYNSKGVVFSAFNQTAFPADFPNLLPDSDTTRGKVSPEI